MRRAVLILTLLLAAAPPAAAQPRPVPTPESILGFVPGTDRMLVPWERIVTYFAALGATSDRVQIREIGRTTGGAPFIVAFISSPANLAALSRLRTIQQQLADPRLVPDSSAAAVLMRRGKVFVLITSGIHSDEVGGFFSPIDVAYRLATASTPEIRRILANTVVMLVPSLNPDGVTIVDRWYEATLGTEAEGTGPPALYNRYSGHDDNRDWYAFTQVETRLVVDSLYDVWHPQVTLDLHEQGRTGPRLFLPPYRDPIEPNVDPLLVAGANALGLAVAWQMTAEGFTGIAVNTLYDAWSPGRAFEHYHGAVRVLSETAGADLASPVTVPFDSLRASGGLDPRRPSWRFVAPWPGGAWGLADVVRYQTASTMSLLETVARQRTEWLRDARDVALRAVHGWPGWPYAFVIPTAGQNAAALGTLLEILRHAQVEVRAARSTFTLGRERFFPGTYVIVLRQPYAAFARAMLERQPYPGTPEYPGGPPRRPYDVTAHDLALLLGVRVLAVADTLAVPLSGPVSAPAPVYRYAGLSTGPEGRGVHVRIAVYAPSVPTPDEGWTRWVLDTWHVPFASASDSVLRAGNLAARFDVVILPSEDPRAIISGLPAGRYPPRFAGGLGTAGIEALRAFVDSGGTLIALNQACDFAIGALGLPVTDVLTDAAPTDFYAPGSQVRLLLDGDSPLAAGMPAQISAWFESGPAFDVADASRARVVARYPSDSGAVLQSGWLVGASRLAGRAALVEVRLGSGRVVLFGFRPQYRGQSVGTFPLFFNALRTSVP
jgi:Zinc carboxypeptidase